MTEKKVTINDTKKVIMDALKAAEKKLEQYENGTLDPQAAAIMKENIATVANAELSLNDVNFGANIATLKRQITTALDSITASVEEQQKVYSDVRKAISLAETELEELFGIKAEALSLVNLINAKEEVAKKYETEHAERVAAAKGELEKLAEEQEEAKATFKKERLEEIAETEKTRKREQEAWEYNFEREKKFKEDQLADQIKAKQLEFDEKCNEFTKELNAYESTLDQKKSELEKREANMDALDAKIKELTESRDKDVADAVAKAKSEELQRHMAETAKIQSDADHKVALVESKNETLTQALEKANKENASLVAKLEKAYEEIREIATKTIDNAGDKKVINQLERLVTQQNNKNNN